MSLLSLCNLVHPPEFPFEVGSTKGWKNSEERLGLALPEDYKAFIDCYGTGKFNNFIIPYNPFAANEYVNLFQALDIHHQASTKVRRMVDCAWSIVHPFELYPANEGLLPWGTTPQLEVSFFWQVKNKPESWITIVYNLRSGEYEVWKLNFVSFLYELFSGKIESLLLPELLLLLRQGIVFQPNQETICYG